MTGITDDQEGRLRSGGPDRLLILAMGALEFFLLLLLWGSAATAFEAGRSFGSRLLYFFSALLWAIAMFVIAVAYWLGDFSELRRTSIWGFLKGAAELVVFGAHNAAKALISLGVCAAVLVVFGSISGDPDPVFRYIALFAVGAVVAGGVIRGVTRGREITVEVRIRGLARTLKGAGAEVERASRTLTSANEALEEIDKELNRKFKALEGRRSLNDQLAEALKADPQVVKAVERARAGEQRRDKFIQIGFFLAGAVVGYLVNWTSDPALKLITRIF